MTPLLGFSDEVEYNASDIMKEIKYQPAQNLSKSDDYSKNDTFASIIQGFIYKIDDV
jgi:hypothetical protein